MERPASALKATKVVARTGTTHAGDLIATVCALKLEKDASVLLLVASSDKRVITLPALRPNPTIDCCLLLASVRG